MKGAVIEDLVAGGGSGGSLEARAPGDDARALASGVLRHAEACWRGDAKAPVFATRLGAYWRFELPPAPAHKPDAFSPHGAGGHGIAWYQTNGEVLGYIPACQAGYQVPVEAIPRLVKCASAGS